MLLILLFTVLIVHIVIFWELNHTVSPVIHRWYWDCWDNYGYRPFIDIWLLNHYRIDFLQLYDIFIYASIATWIVLCTITGLVIEGYIA